MSAGRLWAVWSIMMVVAAAVLRWQFLQGLGTNAPYITFYPAVVIAALYGGLRAGLLTLSLSAAVGIYFWVEPVHTFTLRTPADWLLLATFLTTTVLISFVTEAMHRARARAHAAIQREVAALAQREADERLRFALEQSRTGSWELDLANHTVLRTLQHDRIFGYESLLPEWTYDRFLEHVLPEDRAEVDQRFRAATATLSDWNLECRIRRKDGAVRWIWATGGYQRDAAGSARRMAGIVQDITERKQAETEREKFVMLADSSSEFIGMCDLDLNPLYVNHAGIRMVGLEDMAAACRVKVQDYFFPEDQRFIAEEFFPRVLRDGHGDVEIRLRHFQTGEPIWMFYYLFSIRDARGTPVGWATVSRNITERKRAEALLTGQKQVLEGIAAGVPLADTLAALVHVIEGQSPGTLGSILLLQPDGIHVRHGAAPGLPEAFNRAVEGQPIGPRAGSCGTAMFRRAQVVVEDITTNELWADYLDLAAAHGLRASWSTPIFDAQQRVLGSFASYRRVPGRPGEFDLHLTEVVTHIAAIAIVKEREEAALRESEERLRLALDAARMGTFDWDVPGNRITWSRWHEELWGFKPGEFGGTYEAFSERVHPDDLPGINAEVARCIAARERFTQEFRVVWPDGSVHWIVGVGEFAFDAEGKPARMRGMVKEITDRKHLERALHELTARTLRLQDEERRRLARDLHDTTAQNLAALNMNLAVLEQALPPDTERLHRLLTDCQQLTDRSAQEIRTLAYLLHPPLLEEFGLMRAVRDYAEGFSQRSGIRLELDVEEDLARLPAEDELALFRVLQESLGNVHRHSGSPVARIRLAAEQNEVCLEIADEGRGLPAGVGTGAPAVGVGILGMRERLQQLGGRLELVAGLPGVRVRAMLPLRRAGL